jgi:hypothetical protein
MVVSGSENSYPTGRSGILPVATVIRAIQFQQVIPSIQSILSMT